MKEASANVLVSDDDTVIGGVFSSETTKNRDRAGTSDIGLGSLF